MLIALLAGRVLLILLIRIVLLIALLAGRVLLVLLIRIILLIVLLAGRILLVLLIRIILLIVLLAGRILLVLLIRIILLITLLLSSVGLLGLSVLARALSRLGRWNVCHDSTTFSTKFHIIGDAVAIGTSLHYAHLFSGGASRTARLRRGSGT